MTSTAPTTTTDAEPQVIEFGRVAWASDGFAGVVADIVVDPVARHITHLVIEHRHHHGLARLVPFDAIDDRADHLYVHRTLAELQAMELVSRCDVMGWGAFPTPDEGRTIGRETAAVGVSPSPWPGGPDTGVEQTVVTWDQIPVGTIELDARCLVLTADGHLAGHLDGVAHDRDGHLSGLVIRRGRAWARRTLGVPMAAVDALRTDDVELGLTREELRSVQGREAVAAGPGPG